MIIITDEIKQVLPNTANFVPENENQVGKMNTGSIADTLPMTQQLDREVNFANVGKSAEGYSKGERLRKIGTEETDSHFTLQRRYNGDNNN
jgi:hypothetical protein